MVEDAKKRRLTRRKWVEDVVQQRQARRYAETWSLARAQKKKPAAFCKNITQLMGIIIKQCLRTEQETRSLCGAIFDTVIMATEHDAVKSMREQTRRYNEKVQAAGKGHTLDLGMERFDCVSPEAGNSDRSGQCSDSDRQLEAARRHEHGHGMRPCEVLQGRSDVPVRASSERVAEREREHAGSERGSATYGWLQV